jgi:hypothetical protein
MILSLLAAIAGFAFFRNENARRKLARWFPSLFGGATP